jgi:TM2 domain-containing membrane protein YozV
MSYGIMPPEPGGEGEAARARPAEQPRYQPAVPEHHAPAGQSADYGQVQMPVQPRNRALGAVVSFFIPGVGSMINGSAGRGTLILISYLVSVALCLVLIGFVLAPAVWIWGIVDGVLSADRWNRAHGIIS